MQNLDLLCAVSPCTMKDSAEVAVEVRLRVFRSIFIFAVILSFKCAWAKEAMRDVKPFDRFEGLLSTYEKAKTPNELTEAFSGAMSEERLAFLKSKVKDFADESLPRLLKVGPDSFQMTMEGRIIPIRVVWEPEKILFINNRSIRIDRDATPKQMWSAVTSTLPQFAERPWRPRLIDEARAGLRHYVLLGLAGLVGYGFYWYVDGDPCNAVLTAANECNGELDQLARLLKKHPARSRNKPPACPRNSLDPEREDEARKALRTAIAFQSSLIHGASSVCMSNPKSELAQCVANMQIAMTKLCFRTTTNVDFDPAPKNGSRARP